MEEVMIMMAGRASLSLFFPELRHSSVSAPNHLLEQWQSESALHFDVVMHVLLDHSDGFSMA